MICEARDYSEAANALRFHARLHRRQAEEYKRKYVPASNDTERRINDVAGQHAEALADEYEAAAAELEKLSPQNQDEAD